MLKYKSEIEKETYQAIVLEVDENNALNIPLRDKYIRLKRILERNCKVLTTEDNLQFPSFFARLIFISQKYNISKSLEWRLQNIRIKAAFLLKNESNIISENQYNKAVNTVLALFSLAYLDEKTKIEQEADGEVSVLLPIRLNKIRAQVVEIKSDESLLSCKIDTDEPTDLIEVSYNDSINSSFNDTIQKLWIGAQLNLINVKIDANGCYIPQIIVLEPDYLIDASSMAECFQNYGRTHLHFFRRKFEQTPNSHYILMGNLANFFLDELIYAQNPENIDFDSTFLKAFKQTPFEFTSCDDIKADSDFRAFMSKARTQFDNIKRTIVHDFLANGIQLHKSILEPSFFCEQFGFQGRLDLFQPSISDNDWHRIIELKSGGLPYPKDDAKKIAINHETQTAIYRLIIRSVFECDNRKIQSSILYSASENRGENIRLSAPYSNLEKEIINVRNLIVAMEHDLYVGDAETVRNCFKKTFNVDNYGRVPQFFIDRLSDLEVAFNKSSDLELSYFYRYISFITRELYIQKVGDEGYDSNRSIAALWNTEFAERQEAFDLISDLKIESIEESETDMKIAFERLSTSDFVNFREGEICILYPRDSELDTVLNKQILKGVIAEISDSRVLVRFRYKQRNREFFEKYNTWAIEHDILDHSYNAMYRGLYSFLSASDESKRLLLGLEEPRSQYIEENTKLKLSQEEKRNIVIDKAMKAEDYFLIVGPPGTGKTSVFARKLIELLYADSSKSILVMAYTNRAVDELCETINAALGCDDGYIRVGTELSCSESYRHCLLQTISRQAKNREELRNKLSSTRIYVGTLASITGRPEIFKLKKFDVAIIDEASQILEPQIVGLLPNFDKFIMIGDHKQLSTITLQDEQKSKVSDENLNEIGLFNCRESLFERLFRIAQNRGWSHVYDTLIHQGRMHQDLAVFPNKYFYDNLLVEANTWQIDALGLKMENKNDGYQQFVANNRFGFVSCRAVNNSLSDKLNEKEAEEVVLLAKALVEVYKASNLDFNEKTLGIITPYRNQIALIKHRLMETQISELQNIMVDTVERYQGSQRDVIIVSFCINRPYQLDFFCNLNHDKTVDRKLNVAITRARKQLFLIGNDYILNQHPIYQRLLESTTIMQK